MTTNNNPDIINQTPYLRTSRNFPEDLRQLTVEVNRMYVDVAAAVNNRTISLFPTNRPALTGNTYYISSQTQQFQNRQQELRQVYSFSSTSSITHGINVISPSQFTECFGSYTDGTSSYGLIFGTSTSIAGQISFYVNSTQIVFETGTGAPSLSSGIIVLSWLSQP